MTKITLDSSVTNLNEALLLATADAGANWFQYGSDTYVVAADATVGVGADDVVVKISGLVDLGTAAITAAGLHLAA